MSRSDRFVSKADEIALRTDVDQVKKNLKKLDDSCSTYSHAQIMELQKTEFKTSAVYRDAWKKAMESSNNDLVIALRSYTLEEPSVYRPFNRETREFSGNLGNYHFLSYFALLTRAMKAKSNSNSQPGTLYRGVTGKFTGKPGESIMFQHFLSTSSDVQIANNFGGNDTVFEIQGKVTQTVNMKDYSVYPSEKEWVVWPNEVYTIKSVQNTPNGRKFLLVPVNNGPEHVEL